MPKQAIVTMNADADAAALSVSYNRLLTAGNTYTLSFDEFQRISGTALAGLVDTVTFTDDPVSPRGFDLTASNIAEVPTGAKVGRVEHGVAENDAFILAEATTAIAVGDAVGWVEFGSTVGTDGDGFAGIALGAAAIGEYVWVQVDGWVTTAEGTAAVAEGDLLAFDGAGSLVAAAADGSDAVAIALAADDGGVAPDITIPGVNLLRTRRRQNWLRT